MSERKLGKEMVSGLFERMEKLSVAYQAEERT
jgi:hypothetical protein